MPINTQIALVCVCVCVLLKERKRDEKSNKVAQRKHFTSFIHFAVFENQKIKQSVFEKLEEKKPKIQRENKLTKHEN